MRPACVSQLVPSPHVSRSGRAGLRAGGRGPGRGGVRTGAEGGRGARSRGGGRAGAGLYQGAVMRPCQLLDVPGTIVVSVLLSSASELCCRMGEDRAERPGRTPARHPARRTHPFVWPRRRAGRPGQRIPCRARAPTVGPSPLLLGGFQHGDQEVSASDHGALTLSRGSTTGCTSEQPDLYATTGKAGSTRVVPHGCFRRRPRRPGGEAGRAFPPLPGAHESQEGARQKAPRPCPASIGLARDYLVAISGAGMTPSCCIRPSMSIWPQCSATLPSFTLRMSNTSQATCFPVGGMPMNGPD